MVDHRLSTSQPEDLTGYPKLGEKATFVPFDLFPTEAHNTIPEGKNGWLLFLDEFNSARKEVQAAAYKLILDRMVGQYNLHPNVHMVLAGNLSTDRAITNNISTALQSRVVHLEMEVNFEQWLLDVALPQKYDPRIVAFLSANRGYLMDFRPDHNEKTFCCPRTWEFMNRLVIDKEISDANKSLYAGTITSGVALSLITFTKLANNIPSVATILSNPEEAFVPPDAPSRYLMSSILQHNTTAENFEKIAKYVSRMPADFRVLYYRALRATQPKLQSNPVFIKGMLEISQYMNND